MRDYRKAGFTLIEIIVVIAILAVLFTIALVAINPSRQFALSRNTKRQNDVVAILDGVHQYVVDTKGILPAGIINTAVLIQKNGGVDLCASLVTTYLAGLPVDPQTGNGTAITDCASAYTTNYSIELSATDNRLTVRAPAAELQTSIQITR